MSTQVIGGNPAVTQDGTPVQTGVTTQATQLSTNLQVPEFMLAVPKDELGTDLMKQYVSPPRLKIVQAMTASELKDQFGESAVLCEGAQVTPPINFKGGETESEPIQIVPLFFYPEFIYQSPMGVAPFIRERSTDPNSKVALKCRGQFDKRKVTSEEDPTKFNTYFECLNFVCQIIHPHGFDTPVLITFKGASFAEGRNWCKLAAMPKHVPLYAQIFELTAHREKNEKGQWYQFGVRASIDPETSMISMIRDQAWFEYLRSVHVEMRNAHAEGLLQATYEGEDEPLPPNTVEAESAVKF